MSALSPLLSLVIPAYRESRRLPALVGRWTELALAAREHAVELIVVDDGSPAANVEAERAAAEEAERRLAEAGTPHCVRFDTAGRNQGKGAAVRRGWSLAHPGARWLGFVDADGAVSADEVWRLTRRLAADPPVDVLAATRIRMAGRVIERSLARHLQGRVFATIVEQLYHLGFYDTQCGAKFFRGGSLRPILPLLEEDRWLLDVEVLAILAHGGARMVEEPIDWCDPGGSKVIPLLDPLRMGLRLWTMRRRMTRPGGPLAAGRRGGRA
jgi:glycosyltransferase involved in cell wall biosynthesis